MSLAESILYVPIINEFPTGAAVWKENSVYRPTFAHVMCNEEFMYMTGEDIFSERA